MFRPGEGFAMEPTDDQLLGGNDRAWEDGAFGSLNGFQDQFPMDEHNLNFPVGFQDLPQSNEQAFHQMRFSDSKDESPEQKKKRKNREAAARCQKRKKEQAELLKREVEFLQQLVDQMKKGVPAPLHSRFPAAQMIERPAPLPESETQLPPSQSTPTAMYKLYPNYN